jgi:hypothetical protein
MTPKAASKGFRITGADSKPIVIEDGRYYFNTKDRAERMMLNSLSNEARRVYACLELATMGFQQEMALTKIGGKLRPLTQSDIAKQTGLLKQNVARGLSELEGYGLAERRFLEGGPLRKDQLRLYSWATPQEGKEKSSNRARLLPSWFPESWNPLKPLIKRWKIKASSYEVIALDNPEELAELAELARAYRELEEVIARRLNGNRAQPKKPRIYKEERTERTKEKEPPPPPPPPPPLPLVKDQQLEHLPAKAEDEEDDSLYQQFKTAYPSQKFDEGKTKPAFEALSNAEQCRVLEQVIVYRKSERWIRSLEDDEGRWVPLASNWLKIYGTDPPPYLGKPRGPAKESYFEQRVRELYEERAKEAGNG